LAVARRCDRAAHVVLQHDGVPAVERAGGADLHGRTVIAGGDGDARGAAVAARGRDVLDREDPVAGGALPGPGDEVAPEGGAAGELVDDRLLGVRRAAGADGEDDVVLEDLFALLEAGGWDGREGGPRGRGNGLGGRGNGQQGEDADDHQ